MMTSTNTNPSLYSDPSRKEDLVCTCASRESITSSGLIMCLEATTPMKDLDWYSSQYLFLSPTVFVDDPFMTSEWESMQQCVANATADVADFVIDNHQDCNDDVFHGLFNDCGGKYNEMSSSEEANKLLLEVAILSTQNDLRRRQIEQMHEMMMLRQQRRQLRRSSYPPNESLHILKLMLMRNGSNLMRRRKVSTRRMSNSSYKKDSHQSKAETPSIPIGTIVTFPTKFHQHHDGELGCTYSGICCNEHDDISVLTLPNEIK